MATSTRPPASAADPQRTADREWRGQDESCCITFSNRTLEQMRFECSRAMNGPGGQGVGGFLLGTRLGDYFRIVGYHPIPCEHAMGPDFRLTPGEESGLITRLDGLKSSPEWKDAQVLGWIVSHPRGDLQMTEEERRLHGRVFPGGTLALVAKPDRLGEMELAVHHAGEGIEAAVRLVEPVLSVIPNASFRPASRRASSRRMGSEVEISMLNSPETIAPNTGAAASTRALPGRKKPVVPFVLALMLVCVCGAIYWNWRHAGDAVQRPAAPQNPIELLSLHAYEDSGRFYISWDGNAKPLQRAARVLLIIQDGDHTTRYELSNGEAATGVHLYRRVNSEVKVTLEVREKGGGSVEESTQYVSSEFSAPSLLRITPETAPAEVFDPPPSPPGQEKY